MLSQNENPLRTPINAAVSGRPGKYRKSMIKDGKFNLAIPFEDIVMIQAEHVYVRVYLRNRQSMLYREKLTKIAEVLEKHGFLRVHRSYLVNLRSVSLFSTTYVVVGEHRVTISRSYRERVIKVLEKLGKD